MEIDMSWPLSWIITPRKVRITTTENEEMLRFLTSPTDVSLSSPKKRTIVVWQIIAGPDAGLLVPGIQPGYVDEKPDPRLPVIDGDDESNWLTYAGQEVYQEREKSVYHGRVRPAHGAVHYRTWEDASGSCSGIQLTSRWNLIKENNDGSV
jgi:hypothetical protein